MKDRKIGEIFKHNGEWYQCVKSDGTCNGCVGKFLPYSFCNDFKECVGKIFKKLEKVGEPFSCNYYGDNRLIMMQEYNLYNLDDVTNEDKIPMYITDYKHKRIAITTKIEQLSQTEKQQELITSKNELNMEKGEIYQRKAIMDYLVKYDYLTKDNDDFIEITLWKNGEGYDITMKDKEPFSLTIGQLEAINYLTKKLDYEKEEK